MKSYPNEAVSATSDAALDGNITLQALLYAVACIQNLPKDRQERSNMVAMCALARDSDGPLPFLLWGVEHHVGHEIDLWPVHGGDGSNGEYTDAELNARDTVRAQIADWKRQFEASGALKDAPPSNVITFLAGAGEAEAEAINPSAAIETFMSTLINDRGYEDTPANMLRDPVVDIGMSDVAEEWIAQILVSDDPECEFVDLINHLSGLLHNVELIRNHYNLFTGKAA